MSDPNPRSGTPGGIRDTTGGQGDRDDEGRPNPRSGTPGGIRDTTDGQGDRDDNGADRRDDERATPSDSRDAD